jgi:hypothetical protein
MEQTINCPTIDDAYLCADETTKLIITYFTQYSILHTDKIEPVNIGTLFVCFMQHYNPTSLYDFYEIKRDYDDFLQLYELVKSECIIITNQHLLDYFFENNEYLSDKCLKTILYELNKYKNCENFKKWCVSSNLCTIFEDEQPIEECTVLKKPKRTNSFSKLIKLIKRK